MKDCKHKCDKCKHAYKKGKVYYKYTCNNIDNNTFGDRLSLYPHTKLWKDIDCEPEDKRNIVLQYECTDKIKHIFYNKSLKHVDWPDNVYSKRGGHVYKWHYLSDLKHIE